MQCWKSWNQRGEQDSDSSGVPWIWCRFFGLMGQEKWLKTLICLGNLQPKLQGTCSCRRVLHVFNILDLFLHACGCGTCHGHAQAHKLGMLVCDAKGLYTAIFWAACWDFWRTRAKLPRLEEREKATTRKHTHDMPRECPEACIVIGTSLGPGLSQRGFRSDMRKMAWEGCVPGMPCEWDAKRRRQGI